MACRGPDCTPLGQHPYSAMRARGRPGGRSALAPRWPSCCRSPAPASMSSLPLEQVVVADPYSQVVVPPEAILSKWVWRALPSYLDAIHTPTKLSTHIFVLWHHHPEAAPRGGLPQDGGARGLIHELMGVCVCLNGAHAPCCAPLQATTARPTVVAQASLVQPWHAGGPWWAFQARPTGRPLFNTFAPMA
eukprot:SAG22_NODE_546_length_9261_cov_18.423925_4_plen_190_part_00